MARFYGPDAYMRSLMAQAAPPRKRKRRKASSAKSTKHRSKSRRSKSRRRKSTAKKSATPRRTRRTRRSPSRVRRSRVRRTRRLLHRAPLLFSSKAFPGRHTLPAGYQMARASRAALPMRPLIGPPLGMRRTFHPGLSPSTLALLHERGLSSGLRRKSRKVKSRKSRKARKATLGRMRRKHRGNEPRRYLVKSGNHVVSSTGSKGAARLDRKRASRWGHKRAFVFDALKKKQVR